MHSDTSGLGGGVEKPFLVLCRESTYRSAVPPWDSIYDATWLINSAKVGLEVKWPCSRVLGAQMALVGSWSTGGSFTWNS